MPARYLRLDETDNVAIVVAEGGADAGTEFPGGLISREPIAEGHKIALTAIPQGAPIRRYGQVIGHAAEDLPRGSLVSERKLLLPAAPAFDGLDLATRPGSPGEPLEGYTFQGYRNPDGSVGTRNLLGITTTVQCVQGVLEHAVEKIRAELLPKYPRVDGVVALTHNYGCGIALHAPDSVIPVRTLRAIAANPNFGGQTLVVGLGCEKLQPRMLLPDAEADVYRLQDAEMGFGEMIGQIMHLADERLRVLDERRRETCPASDLVLGMQCGGSDAFSGVTANPAVGYAADLLVRAGATVMFSENTEVRDAVHLLTPRAKTPEVAQDLIRELAWYDDYLARGGADRSANPSPGNKAGGLSNVVEKALGSIAKSGSSPIAGVSGPGERITGKGLHYCATPAGDFVCGTLQVAAGMNLHVFTTGRGTPYGLAMVPVVKVSTRTELARRWADLIDVDAGRIAAGEATIESVGWELFRYYLDVASGRPTWAERHGLHNALALFNPAPVT